MTSERKLLLLSSGAALVMAVMGLAFVVATGSRAILLDSVFNAVYFVAGLATLRIAALVREPDNARFPFGHAYFEALVNAGKGLFILGISMIALGDAVLALAAGGRAIEADRAVAYAGLAVMLCAVTALVLRRARHAVASPLVAADADNWLLNAVVSGALLVAFALGAVLERTAWQGVVPYVDPLLVAGVVLVFLGVPVRMAYAAINELLNRAPPGNLDARVAAAVDAVLADWPVRTRYVRLVRPGRTLYVLVHVVGSEGFRIEGLHTLDAIRAHLDAAIRWIHAPVMVDVVFTANAAWAEPSAGLVAPAEPDQRVDR